MNNNNIIRGSLVALITPFHEDGSVNYDRLEGLVEWHIENGTDALVILGTTAETPTLSREERVNIVRLTIDTTAGRIPVIVGSGSNDTAKAIEESLLYQEMGADALLVVTPYYNKTNKKGLIRHFEMIADAVETPIIMYNVPGRTGCPMTYEAIKILSEHERIIGIKEASGDISLVTKIGRLVSDSFSLYSGNDDMIVPLLSVGGVGVISVLANIMPRETHDMVMEYLDGSIDVARQIQLDYLDFINALFIETNPIPIKAAMNHIGINVGGYRMPLCEMDSENEAHLYRVMEEIFERNFVEVIENVG